MIQIFRSRLRKNYNAHRQFVYFRVFHRKGYKLMHTMTFENKPKESQKEMMKNAFRFTSVRNPYER